MVLCVGEGGVGEVPPHTDLRDPQHGRSTAQRVPSSPSKSFVIVVPLLMGCYFAFEKSLLSAFLPAARGTKCHNSPPKRVFLKRILNLE